MATARAKYTANQVKLIRAIGGKRPIRKIPPQLSPIPLEREYAKVLLDILDEAKAILADVVAAAPGLLESANRARGDTRQDAGESTKLRRLMDTARARLRAAMSSKRLEDIARKFGTRTSIAQKAQLAKQIKAALGVSVLQTDKVIAPLMEGFIAQNVSLITNLTESMATGVETTIARSIQMGTTTRELAAELDGQFSGGLARAQRIARDQVGSMYGQVNAARQKDLGVTRFTWRTVGDEAVRDSHEALADQVFSYDDPPGGILPGQEINCIPEGKTISCHARVEVAYRRWYSGDLTLLVTAAGEPARTTPNHPILTERGFVPAHLVEVGEYVFYAPGERIEGRVRDPQRAVTTAGEIFRAAEALGIAKRARALAGWFHGDAIDQQIDVVNVDWGLRNELNPSLAKLLCEDILSWPDDSASAPSAFLQLLGGALDPADGIVRRASESLAFLCGRLGHAEVHRLGAAARVETLANKLSSNGCAGHAEELREFLHAHPVAVELHRALARVLLCVVGGPVVARDNDAILSQDAAQVVGVDPELVGNLGEPHPILMEHPVRVVEKGICEYSGHVVNLQTACGWYVSQNLLVSNCRCSAEPLLSDLLEE